MNSLQAQGVNLFHALYQPHGPILAEPTGVVPTLNENIREYVAKADALANEKGWVSRPELPTSDEILGIEEAEDSEYVSLIPNQIFGPWPSRDMYLKAHYDLLREDAVAPLRDAVAYVRDDPHMMDSSAVCIYEKVSALSCGFLYYTCMLTCKFS